MYFEQDEIDFKSIEKFIQKFQNHFHNFVHLWVGVILNYSNINVVGCIFFGIYGVNQTLITSILPLKSENSLDKVEVLASADAAHIGI